MLGNLAEMANLMKKAREIQSNMGNIKAELAAAEYTGSSSSNHVHAVATGDFRIKQILISPEIVNDRQLLEEMTAEAVNDALNNAKLAAQQKMAELTGGVKLPEGLNLF